MVHTSVLLHESIEGLNLHPGSVYFDGTLGSAGHAFAACEKGAQVIGVDQDEDALARAESRLQSTCTFTLVKDNYRNIDHVLAALTIDRVDAIMLDLGLSSDQFETSGRGFTFKNDEPLLMTFAKNVTDETLTAKEIVNHWEEESIADIIYGYGEERYARRIAKKIVERRHIKPIETTFELVDIIKEATPWIYHKGRIHPATRTFQALRITVNDEIGSLKEGLEKGFERLKKGGRMAVISFHSIEDRIVKHFYKKLADEEKGLIHTKKPITPSDEEIQTNPRARSAKLRIIEKLTD
jgi:16S rRNA (cytosine1402-N4)-methyltransferase